jgi:hypothetical protein
VKGKQIGRHARRSVDLRSVRSPTSAVGTLGPHVKDVVPGPYDGPDLWADGRDLFVSILTGGRPQLLRRSLQANQALWTSVFPASSVMAYVNQNEPETVGVLKAFNLRHEINPSKSITSIGRGVRLLASAAMQSGCRYWLHLEDDWSVVDSAQSRLRAVMAEARQILETRPLVELVRLRLASERTLDYHMVTKARLSWEQVGGRHRETKSHWTFNPSLVRLGPGAPAHTIARASQLDIQGEVATQRAVNDQHPGLRVAQIVPGLFTHTGDSDSLRVRTHHPW